MSGDIIAGELAVKACQRHLNDLARARAGTKEFPYVFDAKRAARACAFIEHLPHVKGDWAKRKEKIKLEDWQIFGIASIFGWVHQTTKLRRFRRVYEEVPRKNAKSTKAAGIGLYMAFADGEEGAEVYCGATTHQQAWEVYRPAKMMVERTPAMRNALGIEVFASTMVQESTGSRMEPVIGKPGDGASPSCAIIDEYHEHATSELYDTMLTGMGARSQPLLYTITTAGVDLEGPCYQARKEAERVLNGLVVDEELFALIFTLDPDEDWTTEAALWKANPNAGVSVSIDFLRSQQRQAILNAHRSGTFRTKHLNQWVTARSPFFNLEAWKKCEKPFSIEDLEGEIAVVFLDLASKKDLAACIVVVRLPVEGQEEEESEEKRPKFRYRVISKFWLPEQRIDEAKNVPYRAWADAGWIQATPGNIIDYEFIEEYLRGLSSTLELKEVAYDPFQATQLATRMMAEGFPMVEYGATVKNFSEPMKETDKLILAGQIEHDGNPVLSWCMSNVVAKVDAKDNVFPRKERAENKIDGAVGLIGAIGRWMGREVEDDDESFFYAL